MRYFLALDQSIHSGPDDHIINGRDVEYGADGKTEISSRPAQRVVPAFTPPLGSREITEAQAKALLNPPPMLEDVRASRLEGVRRDARAVIEAKYPDWRQRNALLGLEDAGVLEEMREFIRGVRRASNVAERQLERAKSVDALEKITLEFDAPVKP